MYLIIVLNLCLHLFLFYHPISLLVFVDFYYILYIMLSAAIKFSYLLNVKELCCLLNPEKA